MSASDGARSGDLWRVWAFAWMLAVGVGGLLPPLGPHGFQAGGPAYHLVGFSVLTVLLSRAMPAGRAAALAWVYGLVLEGVQGFLPYRGAELGDLAVNLVAVALGMVAVAVRRLAETR